jgi:tetratricopeptide (TPR) repeat protein
MDINPKEIQRKINEFVKEKNYADAVTYLDKLMTKQPKSPFLLILKGKCLISLSKMQEAIALFDSALDIDASDPMTHYYKGFCLQHLSLYDNHPLYGEAIACFDKAIELDSDNVDALLAKAECLQKSGHYQESKDTVKSTKKLNPSIFTAYEGMDSHGLNTINDLKKHIQNDLNVEYVGRGKVKIVYPLYKPNGGCVVIFLISDAGQFYLTDEGETYKVLDKSYDMSSSDIISTFTPIMKYYGCRKEKKTNAFVIDCDPYDIKEKSSYLVQAINFMLDLTIY